MELREERIDMYMAMLADYGFELDPETAYSVAARVVDGDIEWHDIWETKTEEDRDIDEKPIGFIITTESEDAYGLLAAYVVPEYRGTLRAINAIVRLIGNSDPKKYWIYQVRADGARVRYVLTNAMVAAGYRAVTAPVSSVKEWGVPFSVYKWVKAPPKPHIVIEKKNKEELEADANRIINTIQQEESEEFEPMFDTSDFDVQDIVEPGMEEPVDAVSIDNEPMDLPEPDSVNKFDIDVEDMPYDAMVADPSWLRTLGRKPEGELVAKDAVKTVNEAPKASEKDDFDALGMSELYAEAKNAKAEETADEAVPEAEDAETVAEPEPMDDFDLLASQFTAIEPEPEAEPEAEELPIEEEALPETEPAEPVESDEPISFAVTDDSVETEDETSEFDDEIEDAFNTFAMDIEAFANELDETAALELKSKAAEIDQIEDESSEVGFVGLEDNDAPAVNEEPAADAEPEPEETAEEPVEETSEEAIEDRAEETPAEPADEEKEEIDFKLLREEADALTREEDEKRERIEKMREEFDLEWSDFLANVRVSNAAARVRLNAKYR